MIINKSTGEPVDECQITFWRGDSICYNIKADFNGYYIPEVEEGEYVVEADAFGYEPEQRNLSVNQFIECAFDLTPREVIQLDDAEVVADKSKLITHTATGMVFYLSKEAKARRNPFMALQEIPIILADPNSKTVTADNGEMPLILIDGYKVNTGIAPIDPETIESVEIITSPSARYLKDGHTRVMNIKLKRKEHPYLWVELDGRSSIPFDSQEMVGSFEVGTPTTGIYGHVGGTFDHTVTDNYTSTHTSNYRQTYDQKLKNDKSSVSGSLLYKLIPRKNDYFAIKGVYSYSYSKNSTRGQGLLNNGNDIDYSFAGKGRSMTELVSGNAYYKHVFSQDHDMEINLGYDYSRNHLGSHRYDYYDEETPLYSLTNFRNHMHYGYLTASWNKSDRWNNAFEASLNGYISLSQVENLNGNTKIFKNNSYFAQAAAGWSRQFLGKLYLTCTPGIGILRRKDKTYGKNFLLPRLNTGASFKFNTNHSVNLRYYIESEAPDLSLLNPYNISNDPMYQIVGNPNIKPQISHLIFINYGYFGPKGWSCVPGVSYVTSNNMFSKYGYLRDDGVFVSTYRNAGSFHDFGIHTTIIKRIKNGRIYLNGGPQWRYFANQDKHFYFVVHGSFSKYFDKWNVTCDIKYINRNINEVIISDSRNAPVLSTIQINYNITPDFYIGLSLHNFCGKVYTNQYTSTEGFYSHDRIHKNINDFRAEIMFRYTIRKNIKRKTRMDNVLDKSGRHSISIERER